MILYFKYDNLKRELDCRDIDIDSVLKLMVSNFYSSFSLSRNGFEKAQHYKIEKYFYPTAFILNTYYNRCVPNYTSILKFGEENLEKLINYWNLQFFRPQSYDYQTLLFLNENYKKFYKEAVIKSIIE